MDAATQSRSLRQPIANLAPAEGFTLIELMVVMAILAILAAVAVPSFVGSMRTAREVDLRQDLHVMRNAIISYTDDKLKAPQSLDDLVSAGYLKEIPVDPITHQNSTWVTTVDDSIYNIDQTASGIVDVHSGSEDVSSDGTTLFVVVEMKVDAGMTISSEVLKVYDLYLLLARLASREFSGTLGGRLLLIRGYEYFAPQLIFAAGIAGAASLLVESHPLRVQQAHRGRVCEFTVNTLDESIRILKNQLRKRQPVAVLLRQPPADAIGEMLERGLQPDLIAGSDGVADGFEEEFVARGSRVVSVAGKKEEDGLNVTWKIPEAPGLWLPKLDAWFAELFPGDARSHWVAVAPLYLERPLQFERFVRLTRDEALLFAGVLKRKIDAGEVGTPVWLKIGDDDERLVSG